MKSPEAIARELKHREWRQAARIASAARWKWVGFAVYALAMVFIALDWLTLSMVFAAVGGVISVVSGTLLYWWKT
jgi:hypothetical protein